MTDFFELTPEQQSQRLEAAGREALGQWDIVDAQLRLIKYRENAVFEVNTSTGRYALRLHRFGYHSNDELRSELQWMQALSEAGIRVPTIITTRSGQPFVLQGGAGLPGDIQIDLFEWVEGEQLGSVEEGVSDVSTVASSYRTMGELAARVHNQASTWQLPEGFVRHAWDAEGLTGEQPFWGRFWELEAASREQRELLIAGRERVFAALSSLDQSPDVYSMIHADFAPENLMVDGHGVRLIDFDDAGFGWHLFELATSLYFILDEPYVDTARQALIEGYRAHRSLSDEQLEQLPLFLTARGFTYLGWVHTRHETETARELTPALLEMACRQTETYLASE
ncbi:MAG: phosphotransferase [Pseudomonadota bacterium]